MRSLIKQRSSRQLPIFVPISSIHTRIARLTLELPWSGHRARKPVETKPTNISVASGKGSETKKPESREMEVFDELYLRGGHDS